MDEPPRLIMPASAAPGSPVEGEVEKTPDGVQLFRFYSGLIAVIDALLVVYGAFEIAASITAPRTGKLGVEELFAGIFWAFVGGGHLLATLVALFGGRKAWVHTLGIVNVLLSALSCCCTPLAIPILVMYNRPEVRRYYSE